THLSSDLRRLQLFFTKSEHQPCGLISTSTTLQPFGGSKFVHASSGCVPFGSTWYETVFCGTLACALARLDPRPWITATPTPYVATRWKKTRREMSFGLLGTGILRPIH